MTSLVSLMTLNYFKTYMILKKVICTLRRSKNIKFYKFEHTSPIYIANAKNRVLSNFGHNGENGVYSFSWFFTYLKTIQNILMPCWLSGERSLPF